MSVFDSPFNKVFRNPYGSPFNEGAGGGGVWTPAQWFQSSEQGLWLDSSDLATMFQDATGTTPVTAVEQPNGLALDKRLGLVRGAELSTNGTFSSGTAGWTVFGTGTTSASGGIATFGINAANTQAGYEQQVTTVIGKTYEFSANYTKNTTENFALVDLGLGLTLNTAGTSGTITGKVVAASTSTLLRVYAQGNGVNTSTITFDDVSFKLLDGNHLSQATSAARPTLSARVNAMIQSENPMGDAYSMNGFTRTAGTPPAGFPVSARLTHDGATGTNSSYFRQVGAGPVTGFNVLMRDVSGGGDYSIRAQGAADASVWFNLSSGTITTSGGQTHNATITPHSGGGGWYWIAAGINPDYVGPDFRVHPETGMGQVFEIAAIHLGVGTTYQRVNTATDYDTTGFLHYVKLDGVDDGFGTATFAAGTLGSNVDCFMLVRRDSGADVVLGMANPPTQDAYFGVLGDAAVDAQSAVGGPVTYKVDGVTVASNRLALKTAITVGAWHVVEVMGLDLSLWTACRFGNYTGFMLNGAIAEVILAPAQDADARTKAREYLAAKAGITLP